MNTLTRKLVVAAALTFTAAAAAFAGSPQMGTWKFNQAKSDMPAGMGHNTTVTYADGTDGMIKVTVDGVDKDGKPSHWVWEGKFDGKPYKVEGSPIADMIAYTVKDDHTNTLTGTKSGKTTMTGTITVAADGKSRMVTTTITDADGKSTTSKSSYDKE